MILIYNEEPHRVIEFQHRAPGKGPAFVHVRLRNLRTDASCQHRFSSGETVERATLEQHEMEFLYHDGSHYYFMNTENFEQFPIGEDQLGDFKNYLQEGTKAQIEFFDGQPIAVEMPTYVELKVTETEPELKGGHRQPFSEARYPGDGCGHSSSSLYPPGRQGACGPQSGSLPGTGKELTTDN